LGDDTAGLDGAAGLGEDEAGLDGATGFGDEATGLDGTAGFGDDAAAFGLGEDAKGLGDDAAGFVREGLVGADGFGLCGVVAAGEAFITGDLAGVRSGVGMG